MFMLKKYVLKQVVKTVFYEGKFDYGNDKFLF